MAKAKAPRWLTEAFRQGVDAIVATETPVHRTTRAAYPGAHPLCWLAAHDPAKRPCSEGRLERFHFIRRQDVERSLDALLPNRWEWLAELEARMGEHGFWLDADAKAIAAAHAETLRGSDLYPFADVVHIAAWDPRNGGLACEQHHRRYDQHQVSLPRERVIVRYEALPSRVVQFGFDYSEGRLLDRFPSEI